MKSSRNLQRREEAYLYSIFNLPACQQLSYLKFAKREDFVPKATDIRSVVSILLVTECTETQNGKILLKPRVGTGLARDQFFV